MSSAFVKANPDGNYKHTIVGNGIVNGEFFTPSSVQIHRDKFYVLDQFGISSFDLASRKFLQRILVDHEDSQTASWENRNTWIHFVKTISKGMLGMLDTSGGLSLKLPGTNTNTTAKDTFCFDSFGKLYLMNESNISVLDPETGVLIQKIKVPESKEPVEDPKKQVSFTFKIYNDKIYILKTFIKIDGADIASEAKIFVLTLTGELENEITFIKDPKKEILFSGDDFAIIPDIGMIGLIVSHVSNPENSPIQFYSMDGKEVQTVAKLGKLAPLTIEVQKPDKIILSGMESTMGGMPSMSCSLVKFNFQKLDDGSIELKNKETVKSKEFGMVSINMSVSGNEIGFITSGFMENMLDFHVLYLHDDKIERWGGSPTKKGQIFGSIACTVDKEGNLFETSISNSVINQFDKKGLLVSSLDMNLQEISSLMGPLVMFPTILSLEINDDYLFCTNLFPNTITRYDLKQKKWEQLYKENFMSGITHLWLSMKMDDEKLFLLDSTELNEGAPSLSYLLEDYTLEQVNLANSPVFDEKDPPLFVDMIINEKEFQFLDCVHNEIWIFSRMDQNFVQKITIQNAKDCFFSSFDDYADGSLLLCDTNHSQLIRVSKKGETIELIGTKGVLPTGASKEDYEKMPDKFYFPIKVKIHGNTIYVSDLMNCRYHIITPEAKPEIVWNVEEVKIDNYLVFDKRTFDIAFEPATSQDFEFKAVSSVPWIKIEKENGMVKEKKITYTLLGDKMTPWETNKGMITVTFPKYPTLNKEIPVTVTAKGNVVTIQIGSNQGLVNGKSITLDAGSIPLLKNGRTFIGIRFMAEIVFAKTAQVSYDAKTQTVFFELGSKKIELTINKPVAIVNGKQVRLDAPPFIQNGRTLVPLRFVSENLDASVEYNPQTRGITITYPKKKS